jgi:hypothetical protein
MTCSTYFYQTSCSYYTCWQPYGLFIDAADRLFMTQFTEYTNPIVFNASTGQMLGELGTTFGYLATPQNMALKAGANPSFSYIQMGVDNHELNTGSNRCVVCTSREPARVYYSQPNASSR